MNEVGGTVVEHLRNAVKDCHERGLGVASKWASELLNAIPAPKRHRSSNKSAPFFHTSTPARAHSSQGPSFTDQSPVPTQLVDFPDHGASSLPSRHPHAPPLVASSSRDNVLELEHESQEADLLVAACNCMAACEFARVSHMLVDVESSKGRFLYLYSHFLMKEKTALRDWHKLDSNRTQPPVPVNSSLLDLLMLVGDDVEDPWLLFLKALFLSRLSRREEAIEQALLSIAGYPWNWSAWTLLGSCVGDAEELNSLLPLLPLPPTHPLVQMFIVKTQNGLHNPSDHELALVDQLLGVDFFPNSHWVMSLRAKVLYHLHDFARAEAQFEEILEKDPFRIDDIDVYSDILYVTDNKLKLSTLAHTFLALDKDRPEVCCLVGNHYSLRAEHEKAVKYFRRATQLDRTYLSAWTLMGHEYVEMKNSHAAIEAYRRAVDVNRKDYRAWYGLGQAYELLNMHQYALHYYQHATGLRPYDMRLWQAQGMCYEEIGRIREAIECLKRALIGADPIETTINLKLARLHNAVEEFAEATAYHRRVVELCANQGRPVQEYAKSCIYVAQNEMQVLSGDLDLSREYLERVAGSNAEEVTLANELLKKVNTLLSERAQVSDALMHGEEGGR